MSDSPLPANLAFASSLFPSIAAVCRRIGINRQQFNKYLAGQVRPSKHNMRRICDFFGVTESELLLEEKRFAELLSIRRKPAAPERLPAHLRRIEALQRASGGLDRYLGYYFRYFYAFGYPGKITRSFCALTKAEGGYYWKNIEFSRESHLSRTHSVNKYEGLAFMLGDRISIVEYESHMASSITQLILYPSYTKAIDYLVGLQTGGSMKRGRKPAASAVMLEYLGAHAGVRSALRCCGMFDSEQIDPSIRAMIRNEIRPGAYVFEIDEI